MSGKDKDQNKDRLLGMECPISRRDFLNATLLAAGGALLSSVCPTELMAQEHWDGYSGVGDYKNSNGNTFDVMMDGHRMRDRMLEKIEPIDTGEMFDLVVAGGGISGLAAALFFHREKGDRKTCLVLENHPIFGGEAKRNEFVVDGKHLIAHQGSAAFFPPHAGTFFDEFYHGIALDWRQFQYQKWAGNTPEMKLGTTPYMEGGSSSGLYFGKSFGKPGGVWLKDAYANGLKDAPITDEQRRELMAAHRGDESNSGQPKFHGDEASRELDSVTLEAHMVKKLGIRAETIRKFLSPLAGGGSGLGPDALSGYADDAADVLLPWDYSAGSQMFPGGNAGIARHMLKTLLPDTMTGPATLEGICKGQVQFGALDRKGMHTRIRLRSTVTSVQHEGAAHSAPHVNVLYLKNGKVYRVRARQVVIAGGSWTAKHIVRDLSAEHHVAYGQFNRSACLMANVAVRNWRFLSKLGLTEGQWFEGIGNYVAIRKTATFGGGPQTIDPNTPVVLTLKILFSYPGEPIADQCVRGRQELLSTPFQEYERKIRQQFTDMFGAQGFSARRDIAGIVLNRWGHAYLSPQPGFFFGAASTGAGVGGGAGGRMGPGEFLQRNPFGRISFANADLSGIMDHRTSILEGKRAVEQMAKVS